MSCSRNNNNNNDIRQLDLLETRDKGSYTVNKETPPLQRRPSVPPAPPHTTPPRPGTL
ncbi:hypothetical protein E2C01_059377 [Portunus trituberculatus]|uniref:Uncharacterized protein n=1 Tax=Portunus trituberculatus TaxID=210409 RepID=A0A5B7H8X0_PORTR|nr:hypothetical protein [Portunus trituberculatus]